PIQQKGAMVLQGLLAGRFSRTFRQLSDCPITFEQSYGGVEGDSASIAELVAILSELSGVPVRQGVAVTGSLNQNGRAQAVGGVHHKIESFFQACVESGGLTGEQDVVIPRVNADDIVLRDPVVEAFAARKF
ncbi:MAG: S16 family serine protease, partial [Pseudomonadota bacterium]|nr:S16 family serine protease [Pseudomonadota bacterium]